MTNPKINEAMCHHAATIFLPDTLIPWDVLRPRERPAEPERRLVLAILERSIDDLSAPHRGPRYIPCAAPCDNCDALAWIDYDGTSGASVRFTFEEVCEALGIDADALRVGLSRVVPERKLRAT